MSYKDHHGSVEHNLRCPLLSHPLENCSNCGQNTEETNSLWVPPQPGKPAVWVYFCSDQCEDVLAEKYSLQQSSKPKVEPKRLPPEKPGTGMLNIDGTYG